MNAIVNRTTNDLGDFTSNNGGGHDIQPRTAMVEVAASRAAQETQASMIIAKKFPRDLVAAYGRIMQACKRRRLAEQAIYEYPRGGEKITGPSIRLAEALAQNWGNMDFGIVELEQRDGESSIMAFAWDLETNTRQTKVFTVPHERHTRNGVKTLTDPRDIYELVANQGARRLRACILGVIPGDVVESALDECHKTMTNGNKEPLTDRVRTMVVAFAELAVTQAMIEGRLGHNLDSTSEHELAGLRRVYSSLRDGVGSTDQFFNKTKAAPTTDDKLENAPDPTPAPTKKPTPKQSAAEPGGSSSAPKSTVPEPDHAQGSVSPDADAEGQPAGTVVVQQQAEGSDAPENAEQALLAMSAPEFEKCLYDNARDRNKKITRQPFADAMWKFGKSRGVEDFKRLKAEDRWPLYQAIVRSKFNFEHGTIED